MYGQAEEDVAFGSEGAAEPARQAGAWRSLDGERKRDIEEGFSYGCEVLKATVVILLSVALGVGAVMAIRSKSKSVAVRAAIAGGAVVLFASVLKREKEE